MRGDDREARVVGSRTGGTLRAHVCCGEQRLVRRRALCVVAVALCLSVGGGVRAVEGDLSRSGKGQQVLVLGSGGLVGRTLVAWLEDREYTVVHVRNRRHIDLRETGALDVFNETQLAYVFFLACEVGGSKFIENSARDLQIGIIESNIRIYQVVFPWLAARKIPFVFTSSYLHGTANSYGVIKRLGEQWIRNLGPGMFSRTRALALCHARARAHSFRTCNTCIIEARRGRGSKLETKSFGPTLLRAIW